MNGKCILEGDVIMLGLEWYWWLVIVVIFALSIPFKIKFMKWWGKRRQKKTEDKYREKTDKWGGEE